jgi:hypothetical protein
VLCAAPDLEKASVTMPYAELASLLERVSAVERSLEDEVPKPPVPVVVHSAEYHLNCAAPDTTELQASFSISNLSEDWQAVPLVPTSAVLTSIEPSDAKLVPRDGMMCALLEPGADASIHLSLMGPGARASGSRRIVAEFVAIAAARSVLTIQDVGDPSALVVVGAVEANTERTQFGLPSSGTEVRVTRYEAHALKAATWNGVAQYLVSDAEGAVAVDCRLRLLAASNGRTTTAQLQLPPMAELRSLSCSDYEVEYTANGSIIHLRWEDDTEQHREFDLRYTLPVFGLNEPWEVRGVSVANTASWDEAFYLLPFEGYTLNPVEGNWSAMGHVPIWIKSLVGAKTVQTAPVTKLGHFILSVKQLPRLKTSEATISLAEYRTNVVAEGGMLHKSQVTIEHRSQARYDFTLPDDGKLLSCAVNGRPVDPLIEGEGHLAVILPKVKTAETKTVVNYVYTTKGTPLNPVEGRVKLELPHTPLFIYKVQWIVQLPDDYQATALEGNVVIDAGGEAGKPIYLSKQICDDEVPQADLYYTRKDLD